MDAAADRLSAERHESDAPHVASLSADAAAETSPETSMFEPIARALTTAKRLLGAYARLALLDMQRAAMQFAWLVAAGIVITVLLVTAWLAAVVALAVWLLGQGLSWPAVLLVAAALNICAAAFVAWRIRHLFDDVPFTATLREFDVEPAETKRQSS